MAVKTPLLRPTPRPKLMIGLALAGLAAVALTLLVGAASAQPTILADSDERGHWVATWGASPVVGAPSPFPGIVCQASMGITNQTVRDVIFTSVGGDRVQVRLSNTFGAQPLPIGNRRSRSLSRGRRPSRGACSP